MKKLLRDNTKEELLEVAYLQRKQIDFLLKENVQLKSQCVSYEKLSKEKEGAFSVLLKAIEIYVNTNWLIRLFKGTHLFKNILSTFSNENKIK